MECVERPYQKLSTGGSKYERGAITKTEKLLVQRTKYEDCIRSVRTAGCTVVLATKQTQGPSLEPMNVLFQNSFFQGSACTAHHSIIGYLCPYTQLSPADKSSTSE